MSSLFTRGVCIAGGHTYCTRGVQVSSRQLRLYYYLTMTIRTTNPSFIWEKWDRPELLVLQKKYNLDSVIQKGKDELSQMLLLKEWVHQKLPHGNNPKEYQSSLDILEDVKSGEFYCSHYALVFIQCATALGWYSRKLGVDQDHQYGEEEMHHGVADIWSNQFNKWFVVDAMHNLHFEKKGIPLNAYEIRAECLKNKAKDVVGIIGNRSGRVTYKGGDLGFDKPSNYFWFFIIPRNNFFEDPDMYNGKSLLWVDKYNRDKIWYKGGGKKGTSYPHPQYQNQFIKTNDLGLCFPEIVDYSPSTANINH